MLTVLPGGYSPLVILKYLKTEARKNKGRDTRSSVCTCMVVSLVFGFGLLEVNGGGVDLGDR